MNYNQKPARLLVVLLAFSSLMYFSCKRDLARPPDPAGSTATATIPRAANEVVNVWMTTADQSQLLQAQSSINFAADAGSNPTTITVDENKTYQTMDGFGYALTGGSASLING